MSADRQMLRTLTRFVAEARSDGATTAELYVLLDLAIQQVLVTENQQAGES